VRRRTAASPSVSTASRADGRHRIDPRRDRLPKTTTAQCLMTEAPSAIPDAQLAEVHVAVRPREAKNA
jgi:hypothetical protein